MALGIRQKWFAAAAITALAVPATAFAAGENASDSAGTTELPRSFSVRAFYAAANDAPYKGMGDYYSDPELDLGGVTFEYARGFYADANDGALSGELVLAVSIGTGSKKYDDDGKLTMTTLEYEFGVNLRAKLADAVSVFIGPRVGLNYMFLGISADDDDGRGEHDETDSELGLLYGMDVGFDIAFAEHHALTIGVGYRASTAEPFDIDSQSWSRFSIGYKYTF